MKFTVSSKDLARAIAMPVKAASTKGISIPALHCILITATAKTTDANLNVLAITGGDGEMAVTNTIAVIRDAEEGEEKACVDAKLFSDAVKALPTQPITVAVDDKTATITYDGGEYTMPSCPVDEYPVMEEPTDAKTYAIADISETIARAAAYAATGDTAAVRPVMNAVCTSLADDGTGGISREVCASDGRSLFVSGRGVGRGQSPSPILIPARVARMFTMFDTNVLTFTVGAGTTRVEGDGKNVTLRTVDSRYPNYHAVMPTAAPAATMDVKAQDIIPVIRRALTTAVEETSCVVIRSFAGKTDIMATDSAYGRSFHETLPAERVTADFEIGLNGQRLLDTMSMFTAWARGDASVRLNFWSPKRAITITPLFTPDDEDTTVLQMPILIDQ